MKIYFDMDGVLANFDAMRQNSTSLNHPSKSLSEEQKLAKRQFWLDIEKQDNFWHDIPVMDNMKQLLSVAKTKGELFVLSKTPGAKHFVGGQKYVDYVADEKRKWIKENLNEFFDEEHTIICDGDKGELIKPTKEYILVDDRQENITEWESCGGRGVLFTNSIDTINKIEEL